MPHVDISSCKGDNLRTSWSLEYIALGYFTSIWGSFVALTTMTYARQVMDGKHKLLYRTFVVSSGLSLGGSGIWTMHFVGMHALVLRTCERTLVARSFNAALTVISLVAAIICTSMAMHLVMPTTNIGEERKVVDGKEVDLETFKVVVCGRPFEFAAFDVRRYVVASVFLTIAACTMHYMGMVAQSGPYWVEYDYGFVALSVVIALVAALAGLFIVVQITAMDSIDSMKLRIVASLIIGLAVNCMHYTGMSAATYHYTGRRRSSLTYGFGDRLQLAAKEASILSLTGCLVQLAACQHFLAQLHARLKLEHKFSLAKLPNNVQEVLEQVYAQVKGQDSGHLASYIPDLAAADPEKFGIVLCDLKGRLYKVGDVDVPATIQSVSKPLLYLLAMRERGRGLVDGKVGEEPSGRPFSELSIDDQNRAFNPLINTGAITCAGLLHGDDPAGHFAKFERICKRISYAPDKLALNESVYTSEMATNVNNANIAAALVDRDILPKGAGDVALDAYTRICSLDVTALDVAVMGATLANGGDNPITKDHVLHQDHVDRLVTVMMSSGMYNGAGKWIVDVGIPSKSGVAGFLMCVVPGVCGFAVFSPRLDHNGNSTRGVLVAKAMSKKLGLHVLKKEATAGKKRRSRGSRSSRSSFNSASSSARDLLTGEGASASRLSLGTPFKMSQVSPASPLFDTDIEDGCSNSKHDPG